MTKHDECHRNNYINLKQTIMKYLDKSLLLAFMAVLGQNQVLAADGTPPSLTNSAIQQS